MADKQPELQNRTITCGDCGNPFMFTVGEQKFFRTKGYTNDPKRCRNCRRQRKKDRDHEATIESQAFRGAPDVPRVGRR